MKGLPAGAALFVAHPGHEVLLYGWLESARPTVFVLTDGSGRSGESNIAATKKLADQLGVRLGSFLGRYTDRQIYRALIDKDYRPVFNLRDNLVERISGEDVKYLVTDAAEGYSPTHDLCHFISCAAVRIANKTRRQRIDLFDYAVVGRPAAVAEKPKRPIVLQEIDEACFQRKLHAARTYYPDIAMHVEAALTNPTGRFTQRAGLSPMAHSMTGGLEDLRIECLRQVDVYDPDLTPFIGKPFYEERGEDNVVAGYYDQVIRFKEHMSPVIEALWTPTGRSMYAGTSNTLY